MKLIDVLKESIRFAIENTVHKPLVWLGICLLALVYGLSAMADYFPAVSENIILVLALFVAYLLSGMFISGMMLKIFRGEYADFSHPKKSLFQGFQEFIISLIYMIIPAVLLAVSVFFACKDIAYTAGAGDLPELFNSPVTTGGIVVSLILAVILFLIYTPARINFARREKFSAAFDFPVIFRMIKKLTLGKYILGLLLLIPVALLFGIALYILILAVTIIAAFAVMLLSMSTELIIGIVIAVSVIVGLPSGVIYLITMVKYLSGLFVPDEENAAIPPSEDTAGINQEESAVDSAERT